MNHNMLMLTMFLIAGVSLLTFFYSIYGYATNRYRDVKPLILPIGVSICWFIFSLIAITQMLLNQIPRIDNTTIYILALATLFALYKVIRAFAVEKVTHYEVIRKTGIVHKTDR